jgi:hypothetical protein
MTEIQSILCREGFMFLHHDRNIEYPRQRRFYAFASWKKYRVSYAEKDIWCCFMTEMQSILCREGLCCCFMTEIQSILCKVGFTILLYDRNAEYTMQRRFYDSASWQKYSILCREGYMLSLHNRNVAHPMQRYLLACPSWKCIHMHRRLYNSPSSYKWQIQPFQST